MNLNFNIKYSEGYTNNSQIIRQLSENWALENIYCPNCCTQPLKNFANNKKVADFYCQNCYEQFELKAKNGKETNIINDGAYHSMIERINSNSNPNFFFLNYTDYKVANFFIIPKHFFTSEIIIQRKPLAATAKRAGWIGCNINLSQIPQSGKIYLINNGNIIKPEIVKQNFHKTCFLREQTLPNKGWILDILNIMEKIPKQEFCLQDIYVFENFLKIRHPNNNSIQARIRRELQILRDKGFIAFLTKRGNYRKII